MTIRIPSQLLAPIHPIVVHWPFTLVLLATTAECLALWQRKLPFAYLSYWLWWLAFAFIAISDVTGYLAVELTRVPATAIHLLTVTIRYAMASTAGAAAILATRHLVGQRMARGGLSRRPTPLSLGLALITAALLALGDHAGYLLVYDHLIGTRRELHPMLVAYVPLWLLMGLASGLVLGGLALAVLWLLPLASWRIFRRWAGGRRPRTSIRPRP
jgi:uncharacterized membrane protein